jgi:hypothetical protein
VIIKADLIDYVWLVVLRFQNSVFSTQNSIGDSMSGESNIQSKMVMKYIETEEKHPIAIL